MKDDRDKGCLEESLKAGGKIKRKMRRRQSRIVSCNWKDLTVCQLESGPWKIW